MTVVLRKAIAADIPAIEQLIARSAPSCRHTAHLSELPAVAKTRAPKARASWIAVVPMPLLPP